jgi:NADH-quinone oxidoreductase subunit N
VSFTDLWIAMPLLILAVSSIIVLIIGAVMPNRICTVVGVAATVGASLWALQEPPAILAPAWGLAATPLARFFSMLFCLISAAVLVLSHNYNEASKEKSTPQPYYLPPSACSHLLRQPTC